METATCRRFRIRHWRFFSHLDLGISHFSKFCPSQGRQKILFHLGELASGNGIARDQHQFHRLGQFMLMLPETFPEQPPRAVAGDRAANAFLVTTPIAATRRPAGDASRR